MREIKNIVIHCTATHQSATVSGIMNYWKNKLGWKSPGYHYLIDKDGNIHNLQPIERPSNGVAGHNKNSIHVSYIGGIDKKGNPIDNRTEPQIKSMIEIIKELKAQFNDAKILGHRDFPNVKKACPCFDVTEWLDKEELNG